MMDRAWFLSSVAQGTAAFVAIIGGFLVSRLVALVSTQQTERNQATLLNRDLTGVSRRLVRTRDSRARDYVNLRLLDRIEEDLQRSAVRGALSGQPDESWKQAVSDEVEDDCFSIMDRIYQYVALEASRLRVIADRIVASLQADDRSDLDYDDLRSRDPDGFFDPNGDEGSAMDLFVIVRESLPERPRGRFAIDTPRFTPNFGPSREEQAIREAGTSARLNQLATQESILEAEQQTLKERLDVLTIGRVEVPRTDIYVGIAVLSFFSLLGIVLPVSIMAFDSAKPSRWLLNASLGAFFFGLLSVMAYLVYLVRRTATDQAPDS